MSILQVKTLRKQLEKRRNRGELIWCGICKQPIYGLISIDHAIPKAAGGSNRRDNLQPSHPECNWEKADKL